MAGVLLLGGQGSLAKWVGSATTKPGSFTTGKLALAPMTGHGADGCEGWTFSQTGGNSTGAVTSSTPLQPGDVIADTCYYTLTAKGAHLKGSLDLASSFAPAATYATASASAYLNNSATASTSFTSANDGRQVKVVVTITIDQAYAAQPANPPSFTPTLSVRATQQAPS